MRFRDLARDMNRFEQKLENALLYVDFLQHELPIILLKDGSAVILFHLAGLDYEGLSEDEKEQFSHENNSNRVRPYQTTWTRLALLLSSWLDMPPAATI